LITGWLRIYLRLKLGGVESRSRSKKDGVCVFMMTSRNDGRSISVYGGGGGSLADSICGGKGKKEKAKQSRAVGYFFLSLIFNVS
jgi:hypothetical protein